MIQKAKDILHMLYKAGDNLVDHDGVELAGYLSFLTMLAFFPFLVFLFSLLGVAGETKAGTEFISHLLQNLPQHITSAVNPRIDEIVSGPPATLLTVSVLGAVWTASSIVEGVRSVLNRAYRVKTPPNYYWRRSISVLQLILLAVLLVATIVGFVLAPILFNKIVGFFSGVNSAAAIAGSHQQIALPNLPLFSGEWQFIRQILVYTVTLLFISAIYHILPNVKQSWLRTLPGAVITLIGWVLVAKIYSYYLGNFNQLNLIYGSLAGIIAFLFFFFFENIVFIYGAEFNYLLEKYLGHKIEQKEEVKKSAEIDLVEDPKIKKKSKRTK